MLEMIIWNSKQVLFKMLIQTHIGCGGLAAPRTKMVNFQNKGWIPPQVYGKTFSILFDPFIVFHFVSCPVGGQCSPITPPYFICLKRAFLKNTPKIEGAHSFFWHNTEDLQDLQVYLYERKTGGNRRPSWSERQSSLAFLVLPIQTKFYFKGQIQHQII